MTSADKLIREFEKAYGSSDIRKAMANEILALLDMLEEAQRHQSFGYMRKRKQAKKQAPAPEPKAIDDNWIKTGVSND